MTDYFALLDQPRRPWLDPDELKQAFHAKSLQLHPDTQPGVAADAAFAGLNDAYLALQDPKRRIQHFLSLEGRPPPRDSSVPNDIADLFSVVADAIQVSDAAVQKLESATSPLSRSLVKPQMLAAESRLAETLRRIEELHSSALAQSQRFSTGSILGEAEFAELHELYVRFSYLGRWTAELQEKQIRLANT